MEDREKLDFIYRICSENEKLKKYEGMYFSASQDSIRERRWGSEMFDKKCSAENALEDLTKYIYTDFGYE